MKNIKFVIYHLKGWEFSDNELIDKYKSHNFDGVAFYCNGQTCEEIKAQVEYARKIGLFVDTFHGPLKNSGSIWTENCEEYMQLVFKYLNLAKDLGISYFVMHPSGKECISFSKIGLNNFREIAKFCKENEIELLLENLRMVDSLFFLLEKIRYAKVCLDFGHANVWCYKPKDAIKKFKRRIKAVHLHDNDGTYCNDQHLIPMQGNINWQEDIKLLYKYYEGPLSLELDNFKTEEFRYDDLDKYLTDAMNSCKRLKEFI